MKSDHARNLLVGLDLGPASVGWAIFETDATGRSASILHCGVRIFDAGTEGDISSGRDASRNTARQEAKSRRKLLERKAMRKTHLMRVLERIGLFPELPNHSPTERNKGVCNLDESLRDEFYRLHPEYLNAENGGRRLFPYHLRAIGLHERLEPFELGRAIYHLAQRRGFWSNSRKTPTDKDEGEVKAAIHALRVKMGDMRLGEYLAHTGGNIPKGPESRIRGQKLHRDMLQDEFTALWHCQAQFHPALLNKGCYDGVWKAIFWQRPLKSAKHLVGFCTLEKGSRRTPLCTLEAQRFRLLSKLNNLEAISNHGEVAIPDVTQRACLLEHLEKEGDLTFVMARKLMSLNKDWQFNLERGGEKKMEGDRTSAKLRTLLGDAWDALPLEKRSRLVLLVHATNKEAVLARVAARDYGLVPETAAALATIRLEDGYLSHSRSAVLKLMPHLENGVPYATARKIEYGAETPPPLHDRLPPVAIALPGIRNPMVTRTLTEMRRVVNAICDRYGKPAIIRVELARDLKRSRKDRMSVTKNMRSREKERNKAYAEILEMFPGLGLQQRTAVLKKLLAEECGWQCPYCGEMFSPADVFGPHASVDIEHILPRSRSLDNSFLNKTLAHNACNIKKGNRTPFEAFGADTEAFEAMLERVRRFHCDIGAKKAKLHRFEVPDMAVEFADFTNRQLSDTRYASKLALEYLGQLYGGDAAKRVRASSGGVTALVRDMLGLNFILGRGEKSRADHRHHAVDAMAVAMTDQGMIQRIARAAEWAASHRERLSKAPFSGAWEGFIDTATDMIMNIAVSLRHRRKVSGQLHDQTFYSRRGERLSVRKKLEKLSPPEVDRIIDPYIRELVKTRLDALGMQDPAKAFAADANAILLKRLGGTQVKKVRVFVSGKAETIGKGARARTVMTGGNHHMAVYESLDKKGQLVWKGDVVTLMEAKRRTAKGLPPVNRDAPEYGRFLFSLTSGDIVALPDGEGECLWRIRSVWLEKASARLRLTPLHDARPEEQLKQEKLRRQIMLDTLREKGCRKVTVTPMGEIRRDNT
ncbi:type II CRISPR RNA-guided endonuclease Cas9 [Desulfolutivibrio sp.]|uniref:type II CRISPR RNA-guided endonuclease Cas9 n=1 Tax=Desulfolutivibrio sp. TaxID=2773296 RepID=UPI002F96A532